MQNQIQINNKWRTAILSVVLAVALGACNSTAQVRSAPGADIAGMNTFSFVSQLGTDRAGYASFLSTSLKNVTRTALEAKGYRYSETNPDMLVNFSGSSQQKTEVDPMVAAGPGMGGGFYGYRRGLYGAWGGYDPIEQYDEGTLIMDLVDASRQQLLWEGTTKLRKTDISTWTDEDVQKTVQSIVDQVPPAS